MSIEEYININNERKAQRNKHYDPITGEGSNTCERRHFVVNELCYDWQVPSDCFQEKIFQDIDLCNGSIHEYLHRLSLRYTMANIDLVEKEIARARWKHDFEYAAKKFFLIKDKDPNQTKPIPFLLNYGQRRYLKTIYSLDKNGKPIRIIICKRRQVGFSTETQLYYGWKQLSQLPMARTQVVAHVENTAKIIRGMYSLMISNLPGWLFNLPDSTKLRLTPFERSSKTLTVKQIGCRISVGSSEKPDSLAGDDASFVHYSEVALFKSSANINPKQLIQTINSGVAYAPNTGIVYESTARGVGDLFHGEYLRAKRGESGFTPFFSPWFDKTDDVLVIDDYPEFIRNMSEYEQWQFEQGATLEGILWYREASKSQPDKWRWKSEQPTTDVEAFQSSGHRVYPQDDVERLRKNCRDPQFVGDIYAKSDYGADAMEDIEFRQSTNGPFKIWFKPDKDPSKQCNDRYIVVVDVGGRTDSSDNSVICVFDRWDMVNGGVPIVVAEWCGHLPHYLIAWKAVMVASWYNDALLVVETNTLDTEQTEGDGGIFVLDEIANYYDNLYYRTTVEKIEQGFEPIWGWHTNRSTKPKICKHQQKVLAHNMYIETCREAADEHDYMEEKNGTYNAVEGQHDDRHITRAIGVYICYDPVYEPIKAMAYSEKRRLLTKVVGESTL